MGVKKIPKVQSVQSYGALFFVLQIQLRMDSSVPLLTQSLDYYESKVKIIIFLKRQDLLWVSNGLDRKSFESENDRLNAKDAAFEIMKLALSPSLHYLNRSIKDPQEL